MTSVFSTVLQAKTQRGKVFKILKEKYFQPTISFRSSISPKQNTKQGLGHFQPFRVSKSLLNMHVFSGNYRKMHSTKKRESMRFRK